MTQTMAVSKDGNFLFVGTTNGNLYRISNLNFANDSISASVSSPQRVIEVKKLTLSTCNTFGAKSERYVVEADFVSKTNIQ
jgi:sortase (surface protein transpeptidase)